MAVKALRVEKPAGDNIQRRRVHLEGSVQFGAHKADSPLDVPDAFPAPPRAAEQLDVAGVGHGIIGTDQTQERALAASIRAGEGPVLPFPHRPVQVIQHNTAAETDGHAAHTHDGGRQNRIQIGLPGHLFTRLPVCNGDDMRDEGRNFRCPGQHQHQGCGGRQGRQHLRQHLPHGRVQADVGVVNHQHLRAGQQGARELELPQLSRRERNQRLVQHLSKVKQADEFLQAALRSLRISSRPRFLPQLLPGRRRIVLQREEIPPLLHEEIAVSIAPV